MKAENLLVIEDREAGITSPDGKDLVSTSGNEKLHGRFPQSGKWHYFDVLPFCSELISLLSHSFISCCCLALCTYVT